MTVSPTFTAPVIDNIVSPLARIIHYSPACAEVDTEVFFPENGGSNHAAKAVCRSCPLTDECLTYALARPELVGIWGGTSEEDRKKIRKGAHPGRFR